MQVKHSDTELDSSKKQKVDTDEVYDSSKNYFSSVVSKAKRAISKLSTEEHVLTTLTAEQNPSERKIKQTHEMKRCLDAIALSKQVRPFPSISKLSALKIWDAAQAEPFGCQLCACRR